MLYIRAVRVTTPGSLNEHITDVAFSDTVAGPLSQSTRAAMAARIDGGVQVRTHNPTSGAEAPVATRTSSRGIRYITTIANGRETDNLLRLPRF